MEMPEHVESGTASSVVEFSLSEDSEQRRLADVETSEDWNAKVDVLLIVRNLFEKL